MASVQEKQATRLRVLLALYEVTDGNRHARVNYRAIANDLGLEHDVASSAVEYLVDEGLAKWAAMGGMVAIAPPGVREAPQLASNFLAVAYSIAEGHPTRIVWRLRRLQLWTIGHRGSCDCRRAVMAVMSVRGLAERACELAQSQVPVDVAVGELVEASARDRFTLSAAYATAVRHAGGQVALAAVHDVNYRTVDA